VLLLEDRGDGVWEALVSPGRRIPPGREIVFDGADLRAEVLARTPAGGRLLRFRDPERLPALLQALGEIPLPPYITRPLQQESDYQTVYARRPGSSAAPTAGLHFTEEMLEAVRRRVAATVPVCLDIGLATFRPIHAERVEDHDMHAENYLVPEHTAAVLSEAMAAGRRIVAVGTTAVRAVESATEEGRAKAGPGRTELFIRPGYEFQAVGALLTNFHLPRSTLLVLVCALAGRETVLRAYAEAVAQRYRFLSFGDAMLIV
jgi:S-adenosylmethionine:tRNA ribosyltransferase-isomerase